MRTISRVDSLRKVHAVIGGAARASHQLYEYLSKTKNCQVDFFADFGGFGMPPRIKSSTEIMGRDYDVILMNSLRDVLIVGEYVKLYPKTKTIYTDRGNALPNYLRSGIERISPFMVASSFLLNEMRGWLSYYVSITDEQKAAGIKFFSGLKTKIEYIPIAPDPEFRQTGAKKTFQGAIYVGRLDERQKKVTFLIEGIAAILKAHPELNDREMLRIYGAGPDEHRYKTLAKRLHVDGNVSFVGFAAGNALVKAYNNAAFLVSTSAWESPGRVFLESMACGTPILLNQRINCTALNGKKLVSQGGNGMIYRFGDLDDFCAKFYKMYSDPELRRRLSRGAHASSRNVSLTKIMGEYKRIIT